MRVVARLNSILRRMFDRDTVERELDEELQAYLDMRTAQLIGEGHPVDEARRRARLELGGVEKVKEDVRRERAGSVLEEFARDVRHTLRSLRAEPGYALIIIMILALGIGATSALFSMVDRDPPFSEHERLLIGRTTWNGNLAGGWVSRVDYYDFLDQNRTFENLALLTDFTQPFPMITEGEPSLIEVGWVTWNLFETLGVEPLLGRLYRPEEAEPGAPPVVMVSHSFWQDRFGGSSDLVGSTIQVAGAPITVIGILPPDYHFFGEADLWSLINREGPWDTSRGSHSHAVVGRLASGVTKEQAQADLSAIAQVLAEEYPDTNEGKGIALIPLRSFLMFNIRPVLFTLLAATVLVLLIACGNVAGLFLARGQKRLPELAIRSALGAGRGRLIRQLLTESVCLTALAGVLGIALAWLLLRLILQLPSFGYPGLEPPAINGEVLLFALGLSLVTGLVVGIIPALRVSGSDLIRRIGTGARTSEHRRSTRLRSGFVIGQVALSVVLLVVTGLLITSLTRLARVDPGFDADNLFTFGLQVPPADYPDPEQRWQFYDELLGRIRSLPGVEDATMINKVPARHPYQDWGVYPLSGSEVQADAGVSSLARWVPPGYFATMRMPLLEGRDFDETDAIGGGLKIILSEDTARRLFPDGDAIGQLVTIDFTDGAFLEVIGIVGDGRLNGITSDPFRAMYMTYAYMPSTRMQIVVRAERNAAALAAPIREVVREMDRTIPLDSPTTLEAVISEQLGPFRIAILALSLFALLAIVLAAIGLYGVLAFHVRQRSRELGIRMVFGAGRGDIIGRVLRQGYLLVLIGMVVGLVGAALGAGLLRQILFQTSAIEPVTYLVTAAFFAAVALAACLLPARRTLSIDPVESLRAE